MSFWTFCCKSPQVYTSYNYPNQFCSFETPTTNIAPPDGYAQVDGIPTGIFNRPSMVIDNEGDWVSLSDGAGIMSDGTLWAWEGPAAQVAYWLKHGRLPPTTLSTPPMLIDDTGGWTSVETWVGSGFAMKGSSLYAIGDNESGGNIGLGLRSKSPRSGSTYRWRGKLSAPIARVHYTGVGTPEGRSIAANREYTKRPSVAIRSVWNYGLAEIRDDEPGSGASVEFDWGAYIYDIEVTDGGSGYTTPPTAKLVASHEDDAGIEMDAVVEMSGDAVAYVYLNDHEPLWQHKPQVVFTGGDGSGASAQVVEMAGPIRGIRLVEKGTGYTHAPERGLWLAVVATPAEDDEYYPNYSSQYGISIIGYASLEPSHVVEVSKTPSWMISGPFTYGPANTGSSGKVLPFTISAILNQLEADATVVSASLVCSGGREVPLSISGQSASLSHEVGDCGEATPSVKFLMRRNSPSDIGYSLEWEDLPDNENSNFYASIVQSDNSYLEVGEFTQTVQWTGANGRPAGTATSTYEVLDGLARRKTATPGVGVFGNLGTITHTLSPTPQMRTGATDVRWLTIPAEAWIPPSIPEKSQIYFAPPDISGEPAYAEAYAEESNGDTEFGSPTLISAGGLYTQEPEVFEVVGAWPKPTQIPGSWDSVSLGGTTFALKGIGAPVQFYDTKPHLGVKGGRLYSWGETATPREVPGPSLIATFGSESYQSPILRSIMGTVVSGSRPTIPPPPGGTAPPSIPVPHEVSFTKHEERRREALTVYHVESTPAVLVSDRYESVPEVQWPGAGDPPIEISLSLHPRIEWVAVKRGMACDSSGRWYSFGGRGIEYANLFDPPAIKTATREVLMADRRGLLVSDTTLLGKLDQPLLWAQITNSGTGYTTATLNIQPSSVVSIGEVSATVEVLEQTNGFPLLERYTYERPLVYGTGPAVPWSLQVNESGGIVRQYVFLPYQSQTSRLASPPVLTITGDGQGATVEVFAAQYFPHQQRTSVPLITDPDKIERNYAVVGGNFVRFNGWLPYIDQSKRAYEKLGEGYSYKDGRLWEWEGAGEKLMTPLEVTTDNYGSGYSEPPILTLSAQQPDCPIASVSKFDGRVVAVGVIRGGSGYSSPPTITLEGGGGSGATATATIVGPVESVAVTAGGSGYRLPPKVSFDGIGILAEATARLDSQGGVAGVDVTSGGRYRTSPTVTFTPVADVDTITLTDGGQGYSSQPDVLIAGGGGSGATATCEIEDGRVTSVTLVSRGEDFDRPPTVVFLGGGCTTPATATATIAAPGGGAQATARIDGEVLFVDVPAGGQDYTSPPTAVLSESQNWKIGEAQERLAADEITQEQFDEIAASARATAHTRILGKVREITVTYGGRKMASPLSASLVGFAYAGANDASQPVTLPTASSSSRGSYFVEQATAVSQTSTEQDWFYPPDVVFKGSLTPRALVCLSRTASAVRRKTAAKQASEVNRNSSLTVHPSGEIARFSGYGAYAPGVGYYSQLPAVTVEDEAGEGAAASLATVTENGRLDWYAVGWTNSYTIAGGGTNYTMQARLRIAGGVPTSWGSPASATAVVQNGVVTAIEVQNPGAGYGENPTVVLAGGGGSGAAAGAVVKSWSTGSLTSIAVADGGSGYTSAPAVYIISNDTPFGKLAWHKQLVAGIQGGIYPTIRQWVVEYAKKPARVQRSRVGLGDRNQAGNEFGNAQIFAFYDDNGYVEDVFFHQSASFGKTPYETLPTISISGGGPAASGAAATVHHVFWSTAFGPTSFKRA